MPAGRAAQEAGGCEVSEHPSGRGIIRAESASESFFRRENEWLTARIETLEAALKEIAEHENEGGAEGYFGTLAREALKAKGPQ